METSFKSLTDGRLLIIHPNKDKVFRIIAVPSRCDKTYSSSIEVLGHDKLGGEKWENASIMDNTNVLFEALHIVYEQMKRERNKCEQDLHTANGRIAFIDTCTGGDGKRPFIETLNAIKALAKTANVTPGETAHDVPPMGSKLIGDDEMEQFLNLASFNDGCDVVEKQTEAIANTQVQPKPFPNIIPDPTGEAARV